MQILPVAFLILIGAGLFLMFKSQKGKTETDTTTAINPPQDSFVQEVREVLESSYPDIDFTYNEETDTFEPSDKESDGPQTFLGNLRNRTQDMGKADRVEFLQTFFGHLTEQTELTSEILRENLLMRNRTAEEFSQRQIMMNPGDKKNENPFEPIIIAKGEMLFEPVLDLDNAVQPMNVQTMREHGFAFDEFVQIATQNLLKITPEDKDIHWERIADNIWISKMQDDYDAARLFLFPDKISLPVQGALIAYAPSHAVCLVTTNTDDATLKHMIELGNQSSETHRQLSLALWQQTDKGWTRMTAEDRNSVIGRAALIENVTAYNDQQNILDQHFAKMQEDIHVAKVIAVSKKSTEGPPLIKTLSVFIGQGSYLPKTDVVVLGFDEKPKDDTMLEVEWEKFIEIIGEDNLHPHPDYIPTRYIYSSNLSQANIDALLSNAS